MFVNNGGVVGTPFSYPIRFSHHALIAENRRETRQVTVITNSRLPTAEQASTGVNPSNEAKLRASPPST